MSVLRVQGIVIKEVNFGEADKIVTLFTQKQGKIQASAQGARKPKSRLIGATQFLCYGDFVLYSGKNMYRITQGEVLESFYNIRIDIEALSYATYFVELASEVIEEEHGNESLLKLLLNTLYMLSKDTRNDRHIKVVYELRLMSIIGYAPNLIHCIQCGDEKDTYYFNSEIGGIVCDRCIVHKNEKKNMLIEKGTLHAMRYILYSNHNKIFSFEVSEKVLSQLEDVMQDFIITHIGKNFKSLHFLSRILQ